MPMSIRSAFNDAAEYKERMYSELSGRTHPIGDLRHVGDTLVFETALGIELPLAAGCAAYLKAAHPDKTIQFNWLGVAYNIDDGMDAATVAQKVADENITPFPGTFTTKPRISPEAMKGAIEGDDFGALRTVLQHNVYVNAVFEDGGSALTLAAGMEKGRNFVKLLLEHGADVNMPAQDGITPLMAAALGGDVETAKMLLDAGADINAVDTSGRAPPVHATNPEMLAFLKGPYPAEAAERLRHKKEEELAAAARDATTLKRNVTPMAKLKLRKPPAGEAS